MSDVRLVIDRTPEADARASQRRDVARNRSFFVVFKHSPCAILLGDGT
jgi:hypothetical protein